MICFFEDIFEEELNFSDFLKQKGSVFLKFKELMRAKKTSKFKKGGIVQSKVVLGIFPNLNRFRDIVNIKYMHKLWTSIILPKQHLLTQIQKFQKDFYDFYSFQVMNFSRTCEATALRSVTILNSPALPFHLFSYFFKKIAKTLPGTSKHLLRSGEISPSENFFIWFGRCITYRI